MIDIFNFQDPLIQSSFTLFCLQPATLARRNESCFAIKGGNAGKVMYYAFANLLQFSFLSFIFSM